jgi:hypothetical protein
LTVKLTETVSGVVELADDWAAVPDGNPMTIGIIAPLTIISRRVG